ncbi:PREDICTED: nitrogen permease regulator 2-like protein isoform X2 [Amphimedon queenslandica]|uniref:Nitrogen permease regulator 2-like protein n=1 Tax=Amphimedon queenslandica TaxID=400682 RepID=A0AAN0J388_AMPQE|nr:PREDICTED: nitrogen permease regulator 2-like protein isoform X2 [Amphimedon queenslandica]|eukprot:XP_019851509.1 PREDICTED: nitrogen permease regulator 2-like protein isoform X2 [Amphimedon queenslandica]
MAVKCIFFSEFDPVAGPVISYQVPQEFPIREAFDAVHDLIITKPQLYDRLISVDAGGYRIVGCPKSIEDNRYARNALIFNFVLVFDEDTDTTYYEPVVQKLGGAFRTYELESHFLSTKSSKSTIPSILTQLLIRLNSTGICIIRIDDTNTLRLKVSPNVKDPPLVCDHHVPVFTQSSCQFKQLVKDLVAQEIIEYVNGFNHVAKISHLSEYCNVYVPTQKLPQLMTEEELQTRCLQFVSLGDTRPKLADVFRILCSLEAGLSVKDLCFRNDPRSMSIDERKLIQFGIMEGLIHHLQKYPVLNRENSDIPTELQPLIKYLDGSHCFDEICCSLGVSNQTLDELIDKCIDITVCWK